jgi:hypothetical protein
MQYTNDALRDGGRRRWWRGPGFSFEIATRSATWLDRPAGHVALHVGPFRLGVGLTVAAQCGPGYTLLTAEWKLSLPWTRPTLTYDEDRARRGEVA